MKVVGWNSKGQMNRLPIIMNWVTGQLYRCIMQLNLSMDLIRELSLSETFYPNYWWELEVGQDSRAVVVQIIVLRVGGMPPSTRMMASVTQSHFYRRVPLSKFAYLTSTQHFLLFLLFYYCYFYFLNPTLTIFVD